MFAMPSREHVRVQAELECILEQGLCESTLPPAQYLLIQEQHAWVAQGQACHSASRGDTGGGHSLPVLSFLVWLQGSLELEELKKKPYASTLKVTQNTTMKNVCWAPLTTIIK